MISQSLSLVFRYRYRTLTKTPLRTLVRVLLVACAVGPVVALSAVALTLGRETLPYADPERVAIIGASYESSAVGYSMTFADVERLRAAQGIFVGVAASQVARYGGRPDLFDYRTGDHTVRLNGARVSPSFFEVLGTAPKSGRVFTTSSNDGQGSVVMRERLWSRLFAGTPFTAGAPMRLGGSGYSVIGLMADDFAGPELEDVDLWIPWESISQEMKARSQVCCMALARVRTGLSHPEAGRLVSEGLKSKRLLAVPIQLYKHGTQAEALRLLTLIIGLMAVLAAAVLIHSQSFKAMSALNDLAVFQAAGATRWNMWTLVVVEEFLITVAAVPATAAVIAATVTAVTALLSPMSEVPLPVPSLVLQATLGSAVLSLIVAIGTMAFPATQSATVGRIGSQREMMSLSTRRWRNVLSCSVATLVTLVLILTGVIALGALRLSPWRLGFASDRLVVASLRLNSSRYRDAPAIAGFAHRGLAVLSALPGVSDATFSNYVPILAPGRTRVISEGVPRRTEFTEYVVHEDFFKVLQIPFSSGRPFNRLEPERVAVISRSCVGDAGQPTLDATIDIDGPVRIVGIAGDVVSRVANWDSCALYVPETQERSLNIRFILQVAVGRPSLEEEIRRALAGIDVQQPVDRVESLQDIVARAISPRLALAVTILMLAAGGWLVAFVWFGGVTNAAASDRRMEIGVRVAVGGTPLRVTGVLLWQEAWPMALGLVVGLVAALPATQLTRHFVYTLESSDLVAGIALAGSGLFVIALGGASPIWRFARTPAHDLLRF